MNIQDPSNKLKAYCIPGLGTDHRIFQNLIPQLPFDEVEFLDFQDELAFVGEGIEGYAKRLAEKLDKEGKFRAENPPILVGLSLGGFVAVELAKHLPHQKVILISTIKHQEERPWILNLGKKIPLYNWMPAWLSRLLPAWASRITGVTDGPGYRLYRKMLKGWSGNMFRWARHAAVHWENRELPQEVFHVHGTNDHIFTHKRIDADHYIEKGTHYMVMDRAKEIAEVIQLELSELSHTVLNDPAVNHHKGSGKEESSQNH
jgi:pimeloyl-ACP methyl ester carboxylesterase